MLHYITLYYIILHYITLHNRIYYHMILHILLYMDCVFFSQRADRRGASAEAQTRTGDAKARGLRGLQGTAEAQTRTGDAKARGLRGLQGRGLKKKHAG